MATPDGLNILVVEARPDDDAEGRTRNPETPQGETK
jgi:hypothetical protein